MLLDFALFGVSYLFKLVTLFWFLLCQPGAAALPLGLGELNLTYSKITNTKRADYG